jgi:hypothetical protein
LTETQTQSYYFYQKDQVCSRKLGLFGGYDKGEIAIYRSALLSELFFASYRHAFTL